MGKRILIVALVVALGIGVVNFKKVRKFIWKAKKVTTQIVPKEEEQKDFEVKSIIPRMSGTTPYINIDLSHNVDPEDIKGYISITPEIKFSIEENYYGLRLNGDFEPGKSYTVEVLKGMPSSADSQILKESVTQRLVFPDYEPTFSFKVPGMYMSLEGNQTIPVEVVNVDKLEVKVHRVYDNNIVYLLNNMSTYRIPADLGVDLFEKEISIVGELNRKREVPISLREILSNDSHGLFYLVVNEPDAYYWDKERKLILTTDIGIIAKKSDSGLLVWLNSLADTSAISGATVKVFTKTNQQVIQGVTDESGVVHFKGIEFSGDKKPFIITATTDDDLSFIEVDKCALSETDFDIQGRPYLSANYEGFIYSDRGIYRPGETVHLRTIIRSSGFEVPESFPVVLKIKRPDARVFKTLSGVLSEFGTLDIDVAIPDYALTGVYTVNLQLPGSDEVFGDYTFNVEEFIPDRLKVKVDVADKSFKVSEVIPVKVMAEHFFGAAAKDRAVNAYCILRPIDFSPKKYKSYSFTDQTKEFSSRTIPLGDQTSNEQGEVSFELNIPQGILPPSRLNACIGATVLELGGRGVSSSAERLIDPYSYYIGIRKSSEGYANINEKVSFDYLALSPEGEEIATPELKVSVHKVIWDSIVKKDESGKYRYVSEKREELVLEDSIQVQTSDGKFTFIPKDWGDYIVRISGKDKDTHTASAQFYCSGYGYIPWAMERPDRVELKLDKKLYTPGDQAKLVINSPFKGKALITVSKDEVLFTRSVELTSTTQTIDLPIDESFEPNAYCSVTVIRPVALEEKWSAHRAYGIIPVSLDNSQHKLKVDIKTVDSASPKDKIKVNIAVKPQTQLSIALVDEGILSLTSFATPDPFNYFYGKRANTILTSDIYSLLIPEFEDEKLGADSSPAGGKSQEGFNPQKYLNPIRAERVNPVVLWKTDIATDSQGKAEAEFTIPEFSGSLKVMVVASSGSDFGNAESKIKVTEPLMIRPTLPRFLAAGDEFILPVTVFNSSGQSGQATVTIKPSEGFQVLTKDSITVDVDNNAEGSLQFKLKSPDQAVKARIKITASLGSHVVSRTIELPVRPPAPFTTVSGSGSVDAPGEKTLLIPGGWLKGTESASLAVMSLPALEFAGSLNYLIKYPYGCIEQTTSGAYPLLYLKELTTIVNPDASNASAVDTYIDAGIQRILSMQTYTGGFAMWPGYQYPYDWGSVYATDFLVEADKAGYAVPKLDKQAALDYLEEILSGKRGDESLDLKAYACYVLAKAGRVKASWIRRLQEKQENLQGSSRLYLLASLTMLGDKEAVSNMLGQGFPDPKVERETGGSLTSNVRENAVALSIFMDVDPKNSIVPVLIKRLTAAMEKGRWQTTQDNAQALLGLGKYAKYIQSQDSSYFGRVSLGQEVLTEFSSETGAKIKNSSLGGKEVTLSLEGKGTAYYYWSIEGVPVEGVTEEDKGLRIRREFFTREGKPLDMDQIKQGQVVVVDISIEADMEYQNVIVEDLLPACFEIENPRITTSENLEWIKKDIFESDHIDMRDDRLLLFTDLPRKKDMHYRYIVRAVTKGKFTLPPISASCMYDPSIKSVNGKGAVEVEQ
jgi:uncharacterized protein YfaS (alpha-2-macroglobulin family)